MRDLADIDEFALLPEALLRVLQPLAGPSVAVEVTRNSRDKVPETHLRWALAHAAPGNRNDTGFTLARRLRDAGAPPHVARDIVLRFAADVGRRPDEGHGAYTDGEALASLRQVYSKSSSAAGGAIAASPEREARDGVEELVRAAREHGDAAVVFDSIALFATLSAADLGRVKAQLQAALGAKFRARDFEAAIREARVHGRRRRAGSGLPSIVVSDRPLREQSDEAHDRHPARRYMRARSLRQSAR